MILQHINPKKLKFNPWNSNKVNEENFAKLKASLTRLDVFKPILVREDILGNYEIIGGAHRCQAAIELGMTEVPIINLGDIDDDKAKEMSLIDNTRYGTDDKELLDKLLSELESLEDFSAMVPDVPDIDFGDLPTEEETPLPEPKEETSKTIHLKFNDIEKAEEIEAILSKTAFDYDYRYSDGYSNFAEALYHLLILDKKSA